MAETKPSSRPAAFRCLYLLIARVRRSLESPQLIGEAGYRQRYLKVQWWVVLWRVLVLVQIPEVALVRPGRFTRPLSHGFLLMFLALAYTGVFYLLATRTRASGRPYLHVVDVCVCAAFLMMAGIG